MRAHSVRDAHAAVVSSPRDRASESGERLVEGKLAYPYAVEFLSADLARADDIRVAQEGGPRALLGLRGEHVGSFLDLKP